MNGHWAPTLIGLLIDRARIPSLGLRWMPIPRQLVTGVDLAERRWRGAIGEAAASDLGKNDAFVKYRTRDRRDTRICIRFAGPVRQSRFRP